jgi:autotransporter-associated beta strand protein
MRRRPFTILGVSAFILTIEPLATAATRTWTGSESGAWSSAANWGGTAPAPGDDLVFPAGTQNRSMTNDLAPGTAVGSMTFSADGYSILGNALSLGGDIVVDVPANGPLVNTPLTLTKAITITNKSSPPVTLIIGSGASIDLDGFDLTVNGSGQISLWSDISGQGGLSRTFGTGYIVITGNNTFTGPVTIVDGLVTIQSASALGDSAAGTSIEGTGVLRIYTTAATTFAEPLTLASSASTTLVNLVGTNTWSGPIALAVDSHIATGTPFTVSGAISGNYKLGVNAYGGLSFTGSNSYTGGTTIESGALTVAGPASLGPGPVSTWLQSRLIAGPGAYANALSLQGSTFPHGGLAVPSGTVTWTGPITMVSPDSALESVDGTLIVSGDIGGGGGVVKRGAGKAVITGSSSYLGGTAVDGGTLRCASPNCIPDSSYVSVEGLLELAANSSEIIGSLTTMNGSGRVTLEANTHLTTGGNGSTTSWNGVIAGEGAVTFTGSGSKYISNHNTYAGVTHVDGGSVVVSGSLSSLTFVEPNARLAMNNGGSVDAVLSTGGVVAPGDVTARGAATEALVLDASSRFDVVLDGTAPSDFSHLVVSGYTTLGDAQLKVEVASAPAVGDAFAIVQNTSSRAVNGRFKDLPEGAVFDAGGAFFAITYVGGDGNDVVLTTTVAPASEPVDAGTPDADAAKPEPDAGTPPVAETPPGDSPTSAALLDGGAPSSVGSPDGGHIDLGPDGDPFLEPGGCACRASGSGGGPMPAGFVALLLSAWAVRKRRSS